MKNSIGIQVVIVAHNSAQYLRNTLASVEKVMSEFPGKWALLLGDDLSSDNSYEIMREHKSGAQSIRVQKFSTKAVNEAQAKNRLLVYAMQQGSRFPVIALMDADDEMLPDRLKLYDALVDNRHLIVRGGYEIVFSQGTSQYQEATPHGGSFGPWSTLFRVELIPRGGKLFDESITAYSDVALWTELEESGVYIAALPGLRVHRYFIHPSSTTTSVSYEKKQERKQQLITAQDSYRTNKPTRFDDYVRRAKKAVVSTEQVSVVLICHTGYLPLLQRCLQAINGQTLKFHEHVLVLDGCEAPTLPELEGWRIVKGNWANPNHARNYGVACVHSKWVNFADADNLLPAHYVEHCLPVLETASEEVAFVYPDLVYVNEADSQCKKLEMPEWSYWKCREVSLCDSSAIWRTEAVQFVKWNPSVRCQDDYNLVQRLTRAGWKGMRSGVESVIIEHSVEMRRSRAGHELKDGRIESSLWEAWSIGVVCLLAGRSSVFEEWSTYLLEEELPANSYIYLVDNGGSYEFNAKVRNLASKLMRRFKGVSVIDAGKPYKPSEPSEPYLARPRHQHVANLYNLILPRVNEDIVWTLEDDVIPAKGSFRQLFNQFRPYSRTAVVAGVYRSATSPEHICGALNLTSWREVPKYLALKSELVRAGMTGGGCTLYANWALKQVLPMRTSFSQFNALMGWDGNLCAGLTKLGYEIYLHGAVRCRHKTAAVINYLTENKLED